MGPYSFAAKSGKAQKRSGVCHAALSTGELGGTSSSVSRLQPFVEIERIALLSGSIFYATTLRKGKSDNCNLITV